MRTHYLLRRKFIVSAACAVLVACGKNVTDPPADPEDPADDPVLMALVVEAADSTLEVGQRSTLTATGLDQHGNGMALMSEPVYTSQNSGVVTVAGNEATGTSEGSTIVSATVGTVSGALAITVLPSVTASSDDLAQTATDLYDAIDGGQDPTAVVTEVLGSLLPLLSAGDEDLAEELIDEGHPISLDVLPALLARAYQQGSLTSINSFISAAAQAGVTREDGGPLTREYLTEALAPLVAQTEHGAEDILAALVLSLGRERAQRYSQGMTDPVWGDDWLDPLQTFLLLYAFHFSGTQTSPAALMMTSAEGPPAHSLAAAAQLPGWVAQLGFKGIRGLIVGMIGRVVEVPLTWGQAGKASICASILMYGHKFTLSADQTDIHYLHRDGNVLPHQSRVTAELIFDFVPNALGVRILPLIGCHVPPPGAAPDRDVTWTVRDPLPDHGALVEQEAKTDANGKARATYEALEEFWPQELRVLEQSVNGTIDVRATGLVPGWKNLERAVGAGVLNPTDAGIRLFVQYHEPPPAFDVVLTSRLRATVSSGSFDMAGRVEGRIELHESWRELKRVYYFGTRYFDYTTVSGPSCLSPDPIPTTWTGISSFVEVSLLQYQDAGAGDPPELGFTLGATEAGDYPQERVTCGGGSSTNAWWLTFWSAARLQHPLAQISGWTIVSPGVLRREINAPFTLAGFANTTEETVVTLTAVYTPPRPPLP